MNFFNTKTRYENLKQGRSLVYTLHQMRLKVDVEASLQVITAGTLVYVQTRSEEVLETRILSEERHIRDAEKGLQLTKTPHPVEWYEGQLESAERELEYLTQYGEGVVFVSTNRLMYPCFLVPFEDLEELDVPFNALPTR